MVQLLQQFRKSRNKQADKDQRSENDDDSCKTEAQTIKVSPAFEDPLLPDVLNVEIHLNPTFLSEKVSMSTMRFFK